MKKNIIIVLILVIFIIGISIIIISKFINIESKTETNQNTNYIEIDNTEEDSQNNKGEGSMNINIIIKNKTFSATLENNEASRNFINMLPLELNMNELNGNEKYYYLDEKLATASYNPQIINSGDIMLFGNNCLVLFYKTFNTSYNYTKLGNLNNPIGLEDVLGDGNVTVRFEKQ